MGKINLKIQRNCANTSKIFIINFISPIVLCVSYELHYLLSTFDGVRNDSFREDISSKQGHGRLQNEVNNLGAKLLSIEHLVESFLLRLRNPF